WSDRQYHREKRRCEEVASGAGESARHFSLGWVVYEGRFYISPEKAPDPKTGLFKPWILRT
ncbi:MAG TPA: hypothetical protein VKD72_29605, partial [Gemmataceae bacterium]|nr:hypothetical protein [Gemmataceae bacterium]